MTTRKPRPAKAATPAPVEPVEETGRLLHWEQIPSAAQAEARAHGRKAWTAYGQQDRAYGAVKAEALALLPAIGALDSEGRWVPTFGVKFKDIAIAVLPQPKGVEYVIPQKRKDASRVLIVSEETDTYSRRIENFAEVLRDACDARGRKEALAADSHEATVRRTRTARVKGEKGGEVEKVGTSEDDSKFMTVSGKPVKAADIVNILTHSEKPANQTFLAHQFAGWLTLMTSDPSKFVVSDKGRAELLTAMAHFMAVFAAAETTSEAVAISA